MDEITLDDKKYVSTKKAAEMTGYAKDYVGQLCREGRVKARLVGRNWYVLEAAIQDHRFGDPGEEEKPKTAEKSVLPPTWEAPKYEALDQPALPSINRLKLGSEAAVATKQEPAPIQHMQEAWKSWFNEDLTEVPSNTERVVASQTVVESEPVATEKANNLEPESAARVPVKAIYHPPFEEHFDMVPPAAKEAETKPEPLVIGDITTNEVVEARASSKTTSVGNRAVQVALAILVVAAVSLAVLSTGYMDHNMVLLKPVGQFAGVSVYNK